jgi:hypothetical protein
MIVFDFDFNGFVTQTIDFEQKLNRSSRAFFLANHTDRENRLANAFHTLRFTEGLFQVSILNLLH